MYSWRRFRFSCGAGTDILYSQQLGVTDSHTCVLCLWSHILRHVDADTARSFKRWRLPLNLAVSTLFYKDHTLVSFACWWRRTAFLRLSRNTANGVFSKCLSLYRRYTSDSLASCNVFAHSTPLELRFRLRVSSGWEKSIVWICIELIEVIYSRLSEKLTDSFSR